MNTFSDLSKLPVLRNDDADEWLAGEAWVTPQPFASESLGVGEVARVDPATDWVPL